MRYEPLFGVQQSKIAIKVTVSHKKRRGGLALTWANPVNKVKSRNLHVRLRNLFRVRTMVTHVIDGKTSTILPSPFSVGRPTRLLTGFTPTPRRWYQPVRKRGKPGQHTKPAPLNKTRMPSQPLAVNTAQVWSKKVHTTVKSRAKFFTTPCKLPCKCGIYHLCLSFPTSFHFFALHLPRGKFL